jgi:DDE family transposase
VGHQTVAASLDDLGSGPRANRKTKEGQDHPDRDAQFESINQRVRAFQEEGRPAVSVDAKQKELIGDLRDSGREWHRRGQPEEVRAKDFLDQQWGEVLPEGVSDLGRDEGWVNVGVDHDTTEFAAASIRRWWREMGSPVSPGARRPLITADAGGGDGSRSRLGKGVVQDVANDLGPRISVCHVPPGTSKGNKIEHRMFRSITKNWRGKPLDSRAIVVNLIGPTTTEAGLRIQAELDPNADRTGIKVSDQELAAVRLEKASFHGEWNYTIAPRE